MKKITRIAMTTIISFFIGIANLTAAENTPSEKRAIYLLPEVVCTAERTPAVAEIAVALPDMSNIGSLVTTTDGLLAALNEEVYMLQEVICTAERTPAVAEIAVALPDMSNIGNLMTTTDSLLAALDKEAYVPEGFNYIADIAPAPPHRPKRMVSMMRTPNAPRMDPPKPAVEPFVL